MATNGSSPPTIQLYTNRNCPWAHRAHIVLAELGLPFEEITIDLDRPRDPSYLAINPRGLVPTLIYNGEIIPESQIISQFLVDAHPSHLLKTSCESGGALQRARVLFFADTYNSKVRPLWYASVTTPDDNERNEIGAKIVAAVEREIEPLLKDANPFFGGSTKLTLAEVLLGSFIVRLLDLPKYGLLSANLVSELETKTPHFYKWAQAVAAHESVNHIWDAELVAKRTKAKWQKL